MDYDAIIVGAGPAGASAAYWLGEAGRRALVLEKAHLPRYKTCGGGVPKAVFARFPFDFSPVVEREISQVRFRYADGREVAAALPDRPAAMVMRERFDLHILSHARAEVRDGSSLATIQEDETGVDVVTRAGETYRAPYLIGADGANSRVARLAGLRAGKQLGLAVEAEAPATNHLLDEYAQTMLFLFGTPPMGYQWIFPKAEHLSVGAGARARRTGDLRPALEQEMAKLGICVAEAPLRGHALPIYVRHESLQRGRVLLAGDAAGLVDPLLGEGIRHAVDSGRLAAQAVLAGDVDRYSQRVHRQIGDNLLWGLQMARAFYHHPWGCFELGVRNPLFLQEFVALFAGRTSYRRMVTRALPYVLRGVGKRMPIQYAASNP
jgi:geranylgeranyl reductase family protein